MRGSLAIARCYGGIPVILRVWEVGGNVIYLSEDSQFQRLSNGLNALAPVGFPPEDVFTYDPSLAKKIAKGSLDWSSMQKFNALSRQN